MRMPPLSLPVALSVEDATRFIFLCLLVHHTAWSRALATVYVRKRRPSCNAPLLGSWSVVMTHDLGSEKTSWREKESFSLAHWKERLLHNPDMASSRPPAAAAAEAALNSLSKIHISSTPPPSTTASERSDDVSTSGQRIFILLLIAAAKGVSRRSPMLKQKLSDLVQNQPCSYSEHAPSQHVREEHDCNAPRGLNWP